MTQSDLIRANTTQMDNPVLAQLETYWRTLRHAQHVPARSALDPNQIDAALPFSFILQRVAPGTARFRVAGQRVHDHLKMDARGMPFSTLFQGPSREGISDLLEVAFGEPAIIGVPLVSHGTLIRPTVHGAMILLPMQDNHGTTNRLLGALVTPDNTPARARRFEINTDLPMRHETLGLKLAATQLKPRMSMPSKKPAASLQPALRLVVNNG